MPTDIVIDTSLIDFDTTPNFGATGDPRIMPTYFDPADHEPGALDTLLSVLNPIYQAIQGFSTEYAEVTIGGSYYDEESLTHDVAREIGRITGVTQTVAEEAAGALLIHLGITGQMSGAGLTATGGGAVVGVPALTASTVAVGIGTVLEAAGASALDRFDNLDPVDYANSTGGANLNKLSHVFDNPDHNLQGLVTTFGSQKTAMLQSKVK